MTRRVSILFFTALLAVHPAAAQSISLSPSDPKRWDTSLSVGWLGGDKGEIAERWNDWYDAFATSLDVGRYWTSHLKTEIGVTLTSEGDVYSHEQFAVPGQRAPIFFSREHRYGLKAVNVSGAYQLFENSWVHPFAGGGLHLAWERHRIETPFPTAFGPDGRGPFPLPPVDDSRDTTFAARPFLSGGAKFYVSDQGFIRMDVSGAFDRHGATHVWWRIGGGVDF